MTVRVYLDHAATSPLRPDVAEVYRAALGSVGNPSSIHSDGQNARRLLEEARERLAACVGCDPIEVVFTSGGTEAVNLGVKGLFWARNGRSGTRPGAAPARPRIVLPAGEHHATLDTVEWLERACGATIEQLPVDDTGMLAEAGLEAAVARGPDKVALITLLWANNEVGTVQPIASVARTAASHGIPVHVDAVAAMGHLEVNFRAARVAAMSLTAHKIGGPVGIGALLVARSATLEPLLHGGGGQRGIRAGTQDAAGAVAFAFAAERTVEERQRETARLSGLRDHLIAAVRQAVPQAVLRGAAPGPHRLPGNAHFTFPGCDGDSLLFLLDAAGFSVSTGSACQAGVPEVSHVLRAMGLEEDDARGAVRISLGPDSTADQVAALVAALPEAYQRAARAGHSANRLASA